MLDKGWNAKNTSISNTILNYSIAQKENPFYEVEVNDKFRLGCVVGNENTITSALDSKKYSIGKQNLLNKGRCFKLPKNILKSHQKYNAIWKDVELGKITIGSCMSGHKKLKTGALTARCVMDYNNKLMLIPIESDVLGCRKIVS